MIDQLLWLHPDHVSRAQYSEDCGFWYHLKMGRRHVMFLAMVLSCVAIVECALLPESVRWLFGIAEENRSSCGPQIDIETPACKVVEKKAQYELRKYKNNEVRFLGLCKLVGMHFLKSRSKIEKHF